MDPNVRSASNKYLLGVKKKVISNVTACTTALVSGRCQVRTKYKKVDKSCAGVVQREVKVHCADSGENRVA